MAAVQSVAALETLEGVTQGEDEFGKTWEHSWVINPETKSRREYRSGRDSEGKTWQESSMLLEDGTYGSKGSNSDGHHWGEKAGKFANGTSWREKWLEKPATSSTAHGKPPTRTRSTTTTKSKNCST